MTATDFLNLRNFLMGLASGKFDPETTPLLAAMALENLDRDPQVAAVLTHPARKDRS